MEGIYRLGITATVAAVAALALSGCGSSGSSTGGSAASHARTPNSTYDFGGPVRTSPPVSQLPYDKEENAFMGQFLGNDRSTGCLSIIDSQTDCDCAYRKLRAQGHPASQLAAVGSEVDIENNLTAHAPGWLLHAEAECEADNPNG